MYDELKESGEYRLRTACRLAPEAIAIYENAKKSLTLRLTQNNKEPPRMAPWKLFKQMDL